MSKKQRKCLYYAFLSALILAIISLPFLVFGVWTYETGFENFNLGALNGQDSWVVGVPLGTAYYNVVNTLSFQGSKSLEFSKTGTGSFSAAAYRNITPTSNGSFYFAFRRSSNTSASVVIGAQTTPSSLFAFAIYPNSTGQIRYCINGSLSAGNYGNYSANQWYLVNIEYNMAQANDYRFRVKIGDTWGDFTNWTYCNNTTQSVAQIRIEEGYGASHPAFKDYFDDFSISDPTGPTTEITAWNVGGFGKDWNYFSESTENVNPWFTHWLAENSIVDFSGNIIDYGTSTTSPEYSDSAENPLPASTQNIITKNNILNRGTTYYARSRLFGPANDCYAPNWNCFKNQVATGTWLAFTTTQEYTPGAIPDPHDWFSTSSFITDDYLAEKCDGTSTFCFIHSVKVRDFFAPFANFSLNIRGFTENLGEVIDASTTKYFLSMTASLTDIFSMRIPIPILILAEISFILGFFALKAVIRLIRGG